MAWAERQEFFLRFFPFLAALVLIFLLPGAALTAQEGSLSAELERNRNILERAGASPEEKGEAAARLARLYGLAGNTEKAAEYWDYAAGKEAGGAAGAGKTAAAHRARALLERARLLIAQGEYEEAGTSLGSLFGALFEALPAGKGKEALAAEARFLGALADLLRKGEEGPLARLAEEAPGDLRSGLYYALWTFTGKEVWKTRLLTECPASPEALMLQERPVRPAAAPLWLLFPGREGFALSPPVRVNPVPDTVPAAPAPRPSSAQSPAASGAGGTRTTALQVGLYGREENARLMAERLKNAGFTPSVKVRKLEDRSYWAVTVAAGTDSGAVMMRLKDKGFESFPVFGEGAD
jgi:hypothetical protein